MNPSTYINGFLSKIPGVQLPTNSEVELSFFQPSMLDVSTEGETSCEIVQSLIGLQDVNLTSSKSPSLPTLSFLQPSLLDNFIEGEHEVNSPAEDLVSFTGPSQADNSFVEGAAQSLDLEGVAHSSELEGTVESSELEVAAQCFELEGAAQSSELQGAARSSEFD